MTGIKRLSGVLGFELGDGIKVRAEKGNKIGVSLHGNNAVIYYTEKHHFFRELGVLFEHADEGEFEITEDGYFKDISVMLNVSSGAAQTVDAISKMIDYLALMGYSAAMLYTEDVIALEERPHFGYMRGRYTESELRAIDDYAYEYGVEILPCLECYGHMQRYLVWDESAPIRDTASVLLAREEKTFKFLDELIGKVSSCIRSRRINIGMDEAWDMGRGKFLDRHGYVKPIDIFTEYMDRLSDILDKYSYKPMMWCDMYFRSSSKNGTDYYEEYIEIPKATAEKIPKNMSLVFWHYGEAPGCDDYMLKKLNALERHVIYAGGIWDWSSFFPENHYAISTTRDGLEACRNNNVDYAMMTTWYGSSNSFFANLLGLSAFAEMCYDKTSDEDKFRARFESITGGSYDTFFAMSSFHNKFDDGEVYEIFHERFLGQALAWQDVLSGKYDSHLFATPMSGHYAKYAEIIKNAPKDKWSALYDFAYRVFDYLATKCYIAERLHPAYNKGDRKTLLTLSDSYLPQLRAKTEALKNTHRALFMSENKMFGWSSLDVRYGSVIARAETAELLLKAYLAGEINEIAELAEPRLHEPLNAFARYLSLATVTAIL